MNIEPEYSITKTYRELQDLVDGMIEDGKEKIVTFSMYDMGAPGGQVYCPDIGTEKPVIEGKCIFYINYWRVAEDAVYSKEYTDPRWKDIINACNNLLQNGDRFGVFLEGIRYRQTNNGVKYYEFSIGS